MGSCRVVRRVPQGKTLEVLVEAERSGGGGCCVGRIVVGGDFFAFPGEAIDELERVLTGCCDVGCIRGRIVEVLGSVELVGVTVEDVMDAIVGCYCRLCGLGPRECT